MESLVVWIMLKAWAKRGIQVWFGSVWSGLVRASPLTKATYAKTFLKDSYVKLVPTPLTYYSCIGGNLPSFLMSNQ
jgi:hypothetical protein